jgi:hypothetical protein
MATTTDERTGGANSWHLCCFLLSQQLVRKDVALQIQLGIRWRDDVGLLKITIVVEKI